MWDLVLPSAPTWLVQANRAHHVDVFAWLTRDDHDMWSGIRATTVRGTTHLPNHSAYLQVEPNQVVTILGRPFWCWYNESTLAGTYVVAATTYNPTEPPTTNDHTTNDPAPMALIGIALSLCLP